jgi:DNA phosphorothioation-dependent restriction protein DptF
MQAQRLPVPGSGAEQVVGQAALKITAGLKFKDALAREAAVLCRLMESKVERSRIVRIGAGGEVLRCEATDEWLIELEFLDGQTLEEWFETEWTREQVDPWSRVRTASRHVRALAEALCELADLDGDDGGILHRDLKPANVMLTSDGLRLFDFNVARPDDRSEEYTQEIGTSYYRAPEVLMGTDYDQRADLFSLGVIAWELLLQRKFPRQKLLPSLFEPFVVPWPPDELADLPEDVATPLGKLVTGLITDKARRIDDPRKVVALLDEIDAALSRPVSPGEDALAGIDLIQILFELRPNGVLAVVADTPEQDALQRVLRQALQVEDRLEAWLQRRVATAKTSDRPTLIVLAGNAGDGKSHLIDRLIRGEDGGGASIRYIADATHAFRPDETQQARLEAFFAPFATGGQPVAEKVSLIAINTGMVIRFFDSAAGDLSRLYRALQYRLGLRTDRPGDLPFDLEVVNLDLRDLLSPGVDGEKSFFEQMLSRLDPEADGGLLAARWRECDGCSALATCPVHFNLEALRRPQVRAAVTGLLARANLDPEVHLSPRNLWGFLYRLITGGEERYTASRKDAGPCDVVRHHAGRIDGGEWLLDGHLSEVLFRHGDSGSLPLWQALAHIDPAFVSAPELDLLHTRLAVQKRRDISDDELAPMGGGEGRLAGLKLERVIAMLPPDFPASRRRDAAIRRRVLFDAGVFESYRRWGGSGRFERLLEAYDEYCRKADPLEIERDRREELKGLIEDVGQVFIHGAGKQLGTHQFLQVSQPHSRGTSQLMVRVDDRMLKDLFFIKDLLVRDAHILAHADRGDLLRCLGYRPRVITLSLVRHRLIVDLTLHRFLLQVRDGRKPSRRDLAQFEAIFYLGEHIGNALVREQARGKEELYVYDSAEGALHRLYRDGFGEVTLEHCAVEE